eukprot:987954-Alexandrium_andersonii.AAC.1
MVNARQHAAFFDVVDAVAIGPFAGAATLEETDMATLRFWCEGIRSSAASFDFRRDVVHPLASACVRTLEQASCA